MLYDLEEDVFEDEEGCYNMTVFKNSIQFKSYNEVTLYKLCRCLLYAFVICFCPLIMQQNDAYASWM